MANPNAIPQLEQHAVRPVAVVVRKNRTDNCARAILRHIPNRHQWAVVPLALSVFQKVNLDTMLSMNGSARGLSAHLAIIVAEVVNQKELTTVRTHIAKSRYAGKIVFVSTANPAAFRQADRKKVRFYKKIGYRTLGTIIAAA